MANHLWTSLALTSPSGVARSQLRLDDNLPKPHHVGLYSGEEEGFATQQCLGAYAPTLRQEIISAILKGGMSIGVHGLYCRALLRVLNHKNCQSSYFWSWHCL